ncbi:MAG TPA: peptide ABC transporter ATP-binding protein, partial [Clostridiaceae bacterium]|nr:peptide ABC transporter ATP-binding protein [Clostridiaceae bacterium]
MEKLLEVKNLKKYFPVENGIFGRSKQYVKAVDDVTFDIYKSETFGLVGESGCG